jgi:hypothetical protein
MSAIRRTNFRIPTCTIEMNNMRENDSLIQTMSRLAINDDSLFSKSRRGWERGTLARASQGANASTTFIAVEVSWLLNRLTFLSERTFTLISFLKLAN